MRLCTHSVRTYTQRQWFFHRPTLATGLQMEAEEEEGGKKSQCLTLSEMYTVSFKAAS